VRGLRVMAGISGASFYRERLGHRKPQYAGSRQKTAVQDIARLQSGRPCRDRRQRTVLLLRTVADLLAEPVISDRLVALNADFRRWNHSSGVVAGLDPATTNLKAGSNGNRDGRDKPGRDRGEMAGGQSDQHLV
jgi:hypothetical protein